MKFISRKELKASLAAETRLRIMAQERSYSLFHENLELRARMGIMAQLHNLESMKLELAKLSQR